MLGICKLQYNKSGFDFSICLLDRFIGMKVNIITGVIFFRNILEDVDLFNKTLLF